ncbi:MAG: extracellular solute-binding protein, partial [Candidatus Bipolaricaulota bacterium]
MSEDRISRRTFLKGLGTSALAFGFSTFLRRQSAFAQDPSINFLTIQDPFFFSYEELLSEFEEETGIQVKLQGRSTDEIHAELVNSFVAEQKGLDVVGIDQMWLSQYAENKWIIPLDEYIKDDNDEFKPEELVPEVIHSMNEWRGSIYSIPSCAYTMLSFYRKDLFEEAGLTPPPEQQEDWWTWDKHLEYVRELDKLEDVDGTVIVGASPVPIVHMYSQLQASKGARWFEQFPESPWDFTPTINSAENREALEAYKELYDHSPAESISYVWFDAGTAFSTQDIGLYYWWTSYAYLMRRAGYMSDEKSPNFGKIDYGVIPHQPEVDQLTSIGGFSFGIPRYSQSKNEAWEFI